MVEVTQADREFIASIIEQLVGQADPFETAEIRSGEADQTEWVQRATRHRQSAEQRMIDIAQACLDQGYPLAVALEMMKGQNDG